MSSIGSIILRRIVVVCLAVALLSSCGALSSIVTGYLINKVLNNHAPKFQWRGTVTDSDNRGLSNLTVRVRGTVAGDTNVDDFTGLTDGTGHYQVEFKWNEKVSYLVSVLSGGVVVAERNVGNVSKGDQRDDFVVSATVATNVNGVVHDGAGNPLAGVLVLVASAATDGGPTTTLTDTAGTVLYAVTDSSGAFQFTGTVQQYVAVVAYHPDHGFAYATGTDAGGSGNLTLSPVMGATGSFKVSVQVVDSTAVPIASQVLSGDRQFRLRLSTPYNLGAAVDAVVHDNSLFPALSGKPSDSQPVTQTLNVQSTGLLGIADLSLQAVTGGTYALKLLKIDTDDLATAVVTSANPLPLGADSTVVVRVN